MFSSWRLVWLGVGALWLPVDSIANPVGMTVQSGQATAVASGSQLNITASANAVLDWKSFNINPGETARFIQPSAQSVVWNRIFDQNPSQIQGSLAANGFVVLFNQNGFFFGPNSTVQVGGLLATTHPVNPPNLGGGGMWQYNGLPPTASIINYGRIATPEGGSVFLIADHVANEGEINTPGGNIGLYAGKEVEVSDRPDGRGLSVKVKLPTGSVDNKGKLIADAGQILAQARVINQDGIVQANSVREHNGVIELVAADNLALGPNSSISASGDITGPSAGGQITLRSENTLSDSADSTINASGGKEGGNGGDVEISAPRVATIQSAIDGHAATGWLGGGLTFDPTDVVLSNSGTGSAPNGTVNAGDPPDTLTLNINSAFTGFSKISIQATRDITLSPFTTWDLAGSTGISAPGSLLSLQAGRNIVLGDNGRIVGGSGWSVRMVAGADFNTPTGVKSGTGSIFFNSAANGNGNGSLETADGNIDLFAGKDVQVAGGYVRANAGGNVSITTAAGDVNAGTKGDWYQFTRLGSVISQNGLGGITSVGGDVSINAGGNITSILPYSGVYGQGDLTLKAGGQVIGRYFLYGGTGRIEAGTDAGAAFNPLTLAMIGGHWDVNAHRDLFLNEVLNPNGTFNSNRQTSGARVSFQFDYAPDASVSLTGGHSVQLLGSNLSRTTGNRDLLPVYPPQLEINAGSGGVVLGNELTLYPSSLGNLKITTTDGGSLTSTPGNFYQLVMSDSGSADYKTFAFDHAKSPLHLSDPNPVEIDISGNVENVFLRMPKATEMTIGGNTLNFSFEGQNLSVNDVSKIDITGNFSNRGNRTSVTLSAPAMEGVLDSIYAANREIAPKVQYDPATKKLTFIGKMTAAELDYLLHPLVQLVDPNLGPQVDERGNPLYVLAVYTADEAGLRALYAATQDIPETGLASNGLQIGGPGKFEVSAHNLDLGITKGIRSVGPLLNNNLAAVSATGADVDVHLTGNLEMTASQIASFNGGAISVDSLGSLNIGGQLQFSSDDTPKGIFTTSGGNVSVTATGNVNVNGSRIASYNGGNVTVESREADVNAGEGGLGSVSIFRTVVDPVTGKVNISSTTIPGSGILATALEDSPDAVGNITVKAGRDILASRGGVIQLAFNARGTADSSVKLLAARNIDASNSGVIGGNVSLEASGDIKGLVIATRNIDITAQQNVSVTAVAQGGVSISASGNVSGSVIGGSGVSVSGGSITAALVSANVSTSGDASAASIGTPQVAAARSESKLADSADKTVAQNTKPATLEDDKDEKKKKPVLTRKTGRVTVILPNQ
ncbi:MAG TPA: filamentous hemagglutinin N-terminal domain-containing protein [Verrucomicrobiae bacterium]|nr:filamentous hemagglutinin N-terminal domain-containing protein [Verrucomicrobiae bacterium]